MNNDTDWFPIPGYEGIYEASRAGEIRRCSPYSQWTRKKIRNLPPRDRRLKPNLSKVGYLVVGICVNCVSKMRLVHRLVALAWLPKPEGKDYVNHKNGIKTDNRVENLEWVTMDENNVHSRKILGFHFFGQDHQRATLTNSQAIEIRARVRVRGDTRIIAAEYGVKPHTIKSIRRGTSFKYASPS